MKIAVACTDGKVAAHFGHCAVFAIYEAQDGKIIGERELPNPGHKPGFLPVFLHEQGIDVLIAGGIGSAAAEIFADKNITVAAGASGDCRTVAEEYLEGRFSGSGVICQH